MSPRLPASKSAPRINTSDDDDALVVAAPGPVSTVQASVRWLEIGYLAGYGAAPYEVPAKDRAVFANAGCVT